MKELNELIDRYDVSCHCSAVYVRPKQDGHLVMYSDYASLAQRAEAAEAALTEEKRINSKLREDRAGLARECNAFQAKLAEIQKQKSVGTVSIAMDWSTHRNIATVNMRPDLVLAEMKDGDELFTRPAPAINLAELVPCEVNRGNEDVFDVGFANGFNACRAAMLRKIEEQSQ